MTATVRSARPKPCPFCGAAPQVKHYHYEPFQVVIACDHRGCGVAPRAVGATKEKAMKLWNRRAPTGDD
jgi:Lar family restriction alleviation protein